MTSTMKGPIPTTALNGDWGTFYNTLLEEVVDLVNKFWDSNRDHLIIDIHKALALKDHRRIAMLAFVECVVFADEGCSSLLEKITAFRAEIVANFEPIEWIWEKAGCDAYLPAGHHYDKQKRVQIFSTTTNKVDWNAANKANARSLNSGWALAEPTSLTVSHKSPAESKPADTNANQPKSIYNEENEEKEAIEDWGEAVEFWADLNDGGLLPPVPDPSATCGLEDIFPVPGLNQKTNAEPATPQAASRLGPINGTPFAWCLRCAKRIGQEGQHPCSRTHSYEECRYCQQLGKECLSVPVPLRGDVTKLLLLGPDLQQAAVSEFSKKADAYSRTVGNNTEKEKLIVMQSLNCNMFRLVNAVRASSGQSVFPDEEEQVWPEVHGGVVEGQEGW